MNAFDFNKPFGPVIDLLKKIEKHTETAACCAVASEGGGETPESGNECTVAGENTDIPAGLKSFSIIKTSEDGTITVLLQNGFYTLSLEGEGISDSAEEGNLLPAYIVITGDGATWKWHGIGCNIPPVADLSLPSVDCETEVEFQEGFQAFPQQRNVVIGPGVGTVTFDFNAFNIPDRFIVEFDGEVVIDTGYRGASGQQSALNAELASRGEDPATIQGVGLGSASFEKTTTTQFITVKVYAPLPDTQWNYTVGCTP